MMKLHIVMSVSLAVLLTAGAGQTQGIDTEAKPKFMDFAQFETVVAADKLRFVDHLRWAGLKIVKSPAVERVVPLFKYSEDDLRKSECSIKHLKGHYALVVANLIPSASVYAASSSDPKEQRKLERLKAEVSNGSWLTKEDVENAKLKPEILEQFNIKPKPVWNEISFSNSCELKDTITGFGYIGAHKWYSVKDPKLRSIAKAGLRVPSKPSIIAATSLFGERSGEAPYFAECQANIKAKESGSSLCEQVVARQ